MGSDHLHPCHIFIDKEGRWWHNGAEMVRRDIIRSFYENLVMDADGSYSIIWQGEHCSVEVEDTAYTVWQVTAQGLDPERGYRVDLSLSDESREALAPETLAVGKDHVLYCRVKNCSFPARFTRPAYYQLSDYIREDDQGFYLLSKGRRYYLSEKSIPTQKQEKPPKADTSPS